jgi:hypothetical protein
MNTRLANYRWSIDRTLEDDRRENPVPVDDTPHPHFHSHGGKQHTHVHQHPEDHAHSTRLDLPGHDE